jgi:heme A synthase
VVIWVVCGLALAFTVLGLILDRRSLVASSLLYFTAVLSYAAVQAGAGFTTVLAGVPLAIGLLVIILGLAWNPLRDLVLRVVPFASLFRPPSEV